MPGWNMARRLCLGDGISTVVKRGLDSWGDSHATMFCPG